MEISSESGRVARFKNLAKGVSKKRKRELEQALLRPSVIPAYTKPAPKFSDLELRTIKIIVPSIQDVELIRKMFKVTDYGGTCIANSRDFMKVLRYYRKRKKKK